MERIRKISAKVRGALRNLAPKPGSKKPTSQFTDAPRPPVRDERRSEVGRWVPYRNWFKT